MLALGFNFLLDDTELRSKVGLKFLLWEDTNQSKLLYIYYIYIYIYIYMYISLLLYLLSRGQVPTTKYIEEGGQLTGGSC